MAGISFQFWGPGPHWMYHQMGQDVVVAVYELNGTMEQIEGCIIKVGWGSVEVTLPAGAGGNGCRVVVVG